MQTNHFLSKRKGNLGIGHNRYSTSGEKDDLQLAQPFVVHTSFGTLSVAHNGELVNSKKLRKKVLESGKCDFWKDSLFIGSFIIFCNEWYCVSR